MNRLWPTGVVLVFPLALLAALLLVPAGTRGGEPAGEDTLEIPGTGREPPTHYKQEGPIRPDYLERLVVDLVWGTTKTRRHAARQLGFLRDQRAIEPLIAALDDDDPTAALNAAYSLCDLAAKWEIPVMMYLLSHHHPEAGYRGQKKLREMVYRYDGPYHLRAVDFFMQVPEEKLDTLERWHMWWNRIRSSLNERPHPPASPLTVEEIERDMTKTHPYQQDPPEDILRQEGYISPAGWIPDASYQGRQLSSLLLPNLVNALQGSDNARIAAMRFLVKFLNGAEWPDDLLQRWVHMHEDEREAQEAGLHPYLEVYHLRQEQRPWMAGSGVGVFRAPENPDDFWRQEWRHRDDEYLRVRDQLPTLLPALEGNLRAGSVDVRLWAMKTCARLGYNPEGRVVQQIADTVRRQANARQPGDVHEMGHAAFALGLFGAREGIEPLINALNNENSFIRDICFMSLMNILGREFGIYSSYAPLPPGDEPPPDELAAIEIPAFVQAREHFDDAATRRWAWLNDQRYRWFDHQPIRDAAAARWRHWLEWYLEVEQRVNNRINQLSEQNPWADRERALYALVRDGYRAYPNLVAQLRQPTDDEQLWRMKRALQMIRRDLARPLERPPAPPDPREPGYEEFVATDPRAAVPLEPPPLPPEEDPGGRIVEPPDPGLERLDPTPEVSQ